MKKICLIFLSIIIFLMFKTTVNAKTANIYVFYGKTCPHCHEAIKYLDSIKDSYDVNIIKYEVWNNENNYKLMKTVSNYLDVNARGVPFIVIDNTPIIGYNNNTNQTYIYHIKRANEDNFVDKVGEKLGIIKQEKIK